MYIGNRCSNIYPVVRWIKPKYDCVYNFSIKLGPMAYDYVDDFKIKKGMVCGGKDWEGGVGTSTQL